MLWLAARIGVEPTTVAEAACACARTAIPNLPSDHKVLKALDTAEAWTHGEATIQEVQQAATAIDTADVGKYSWVAHHYGSASTAAEVAATYAVAYAAYGRADAAEQAAAYAVDAASYGVNPNRTKAWNRCAKIVRKHIPWTILQAAWLRLIPENGTAESGG
jgi:hypothetical protein